MDLEEYKAGKIIKLEDSIQRCRNYLSSEDAKHHRNNRKRQERHLDNCLKHLEEFRSGNLTEESLYFFEQNYKHVPFNKDTVLVDFSAY